MALLDQAVVSGTSFAATVIVGRFVGPGALGLYSLAVTIAILIASMQESMVSMPYTLRVRALDGRERAVYAGSSLILFLAIASASVGAAAIAAVVMSAGAEQIGLIHILWAGTAILPCFLLREFGRRFLFAHLRIRSALALDATVAVVQLGALGWLAWSGRLSALSAAAALGSGCAIAGIAWLVAARRDFVVRPGEIRAVAWRNWTFGRWLFGGRLLSALNSDVLLLWVIALVLDHKAAGVFAACRTVVLVSNPFILGIGNIVTPQLADAYAEGGVAKLRRAVWQTTGLVGLPMAGISLLVWFFGGDALRLLYGAQYIGQGATVTILALGILASALSIGATNGLWAMNRPDLTFKAGLMGVVTTVVLAYLLARPLHVLGAAYGLLAGLAVEAAARGVMFSRLADRDAGHPATVREDAGPGRLPSVAVGSAELRPTL